MSKLKEICESLEAKIQAAYEQGTTLEAAERLASEFLYAQLQISCTLRNKDLDARMKKSGTKAVKAAIYLDIVQKADKKPTEAQIAAMIDSNDLVSGEQNALDEAEVDRDELERYYDIFTNAHIHFRGLAKGQFGS